MENEFEDELIISMYHPSVIKTREKIGCYTKCTTFNASCHLTCIEFEEQLMLVI